MENTPQEKLSKLNDRKNEAMLLQQFALPYLFRWQSPPMYDIALYPRSTSIRIIPAGAGIFFLFFKPSSASNLSILIKSLLSPSTASKTSLSYTSSIYTAQHSTAQKILYSAKNFLYCLH